MTWRTIRSWPVFSIIVLAVLLTGAIGAPWLAPYEPEAGTLREARQPPVLFEGTGGHILGTDTIGRDVLTRLMYGGRVSLLVAGVVLCISGSVGTLLGLLSGYVGGWVDEALMRLVDALYSIPLILVALAVAASFGASLKMLLVVLALWMWAGYARQVRGEVLRLKMMDYVALAKVAGASTPRILLRHIFPGVVNTVVVVGTGLVGSVILTEAGLSFLGAGIPPPTPTWGGMVSENRIYMSSAWWMVMLPGLAIGLSVMAFVFLGDWLRDKLDPRLRQL